MALPDSFDPNDPRLRLPDPNDPASLPKIPVPPPAGRPTQGVGWGNLIFTILALIGMAACAPVFFKMRSMEGDEVFTAPVLLPVLGFFFSLVVFAATVGIRFVYWFADWFVDFLFGTHGGGYSDTKPVDVTWELPRQPKPPQKPAGPSGPETPPPHRGPL